MLIALAGLPGTGKTTIASRLAAELGGVVLGKDTVRAALFPGPALDYSREQDDLCMAAIYQAARYILRASSNPVLIDGRTFLRAYQVRDLLALADAVGEPPRLVECVCADEVAWERLARDRERGTHVAANRTYALYQARKAAVEPITVPHLVLDTGRTPLADCIAHCLEYLPRG